MIEVVKGSLEERIIRVLQKEYPITMKELSKKLGISERKTRMEILKLQSKGILEMEPLPDKIFIRLLRFDFVFVGRRRQYKFIKKKRMKMEENDESSDEDGIMYG